MRPRLCALIVFFFFDFIFSENDSYSKYLLRARVPVMDSKECKKHASELQPQHICVGEAISMGTTTCTVRTQDIFTIKVLN